MSDLLIITGLVPKEQHEQKFETILISHKENYLIHVLVIKLFFNELVDNHYYKIMTRNGWACFDHIEEARQFWAKNCA